MDGNAGFHKVSVTSKLIILQKFCAQKMRRFGFCMIGERKKT